VPCQPVGQINIEMDGSPGFGWVSLLRDQRSECPHSGHCHMGMLWKDIVE
jgi:hypothetical protein